MNRTNALTAATAALALTTALAACGSSGATSSPNTAANGKTASTPATSTTTPSAAPVVPAGTITVDTTEYAFAPTTIAAKAGKVSFSLDNKGKIPHELIVLKTGAAPGSLKVNASTSRVSESTSVGEVSETPAGETKSTTLDLKPGTYLYVCNIPTHYMQGMRGVLTVK